MSLIRLSLVALPLVGGLSTGSLSRQPIDPAGRAMAKNDLFDAREGGKPVSSHCKRQDWGIAKLEVTGEAPPAFSQKPWVVFRGATFRSSVAAQEEAFSSIARHAIQPLKKAYNLSSVHVHLCVRPHKDNSRITGSAEKHFGVAKGDVSLREVSETEHPLQRDLFRTCMDDVPSDAGFALVLRPDLVFMESLQFERALSADRFYFQWNLFQYCVNKEVADQIHLVGGNLIQGMKDKWDNAKMGGTSPKWGYYDTFHMMYNWAVEAFGKERMGYLNEYPAENCVYNNPDDPCIINNNDCAAESFFDEARYGFCKQRGNPGAPWAQKGNITRNITNPLFKYDHVTTWNGPAPQLG